MQGNKERQYNSVVVDHAPCRCLLLGSRQQAQLWTCTHVPLPDERCSVVRLPCFRAALTSFLGPFPLSKHTADANTAWQNPQGFCLAVCLTVLNVNTCWVVMNNYSRHCVMILGLCLLRCTRVQAAAVAAGLTLRSGLSHCLTSHTSANWPSPSLLVT